MTPDERWWGSWKVLILFKAEAKQRRVCVPEQYRYRSNDQRIKSKHWSEDRIRKGKQTLMGIRPDYIFAS